MPFNGFHFSKQISTATSDSDHIEDGDAVCASHSHILVPLTTNVWAQLDGILWVPYARYLRKQSYHMFSDICTGKQHGQALVGKRTVMRVERQKVTHLMHRLIVNPIHLVQYSVDIAFNSISIRICGKEMIAHTTTTNQTTSEQLIMPIDRVVLA